MNVHVIRVFRLCRILILATAMPAAANDGVAATAAALEAIRDSRSALEVCDLVRARALYEHAEHLLNRGANNNQLARALKSDIAELGNEIGRIEKQVEATQAQLGILIQRKRWIAAEVVLNSSGSQACPSLYRPFRAVIENGRKPAYDGPGFWSRFRSGLKISVIVAATAAGGVIAIDEVAKR